MAHRAIQTQIEQAFLTGWTIPALAEHYGVSKRTLRRWAKAGDWEARREVKLTPREEVAALRKEVESASSQAESVASQVEAVERQAQQLVDVLEMTTRHLRFARALQSIVGKALQTLDPNELAPRDLLAFLDLGVKIETLIAGKATERLEIHNIDMSQLTDEQLQQIAAGKDPRKVLEAAWAAS